MGPQLWDCGVPAADNQVTVVAGHHYDWDHYYGTAVVPAADSQVTVVAGHHYGWDHYYGTAGSTCG